jgi:hypothetical protein
MIKTNNLMPFFEQAGLDETDIIFVKELIFGPLTELANNEVGLELYILLHKTIYRCLRFQ